MSDGPLVLLIGAPLPPPYGGIARYMQLCLPAMVRRGYRLRIVRPDQGVEPLAAGGPATDADIETAVYAYPGPVRLIAWLLRRPRIASRLLSLYAHAIVRQPGFATRQLAATACWLRTAEEILGAEHPSITHAYDWPWSHGAAAVVLAENAVARA